MPCLFVRFSDSTYLGVNHSTHIFDMHFQKNILYLDGSLAFCRIQPYSNWYLTEKVRCGIQQQYYICNKSNQGDDGGDCPGSIFYKMEIIMKVIAKVETDFPAKFGIPRQSGLVEKLPGRIVFEPEYRNPDAVRGLEGFSHIWVLWSFSQSVNQSWSPTVRPPRLGGNKRMGVFATRSPFRPNPIGLSSVRLEEIRMEQGIGPVLYVTGIDMMDQTSVYDIKPYLPYVDSHPDAAGGFAEDVEQYRLDVEIPADLSLKVPGLQRELLKEILAEDPRPSYQQDAQRIYGMEFAGLEVKFVVKGNKLTVCGIENV